MVVEAWSEATHFMEDGKKREPQEGVRDKISPKIHPEFFLTGTTS
jgi:hypothetical protein